MKKTIKWVVALALAAAAGGYGYQRQRAKKAAGQRPQYDRASAELRDLRIVVESTGEIQPRNRLDVKPPIAGRLEELLVDEGDAVEKGQLIGWVSSTERATLLDAALATSAEEAEYWRQLFKPTPLISPIKGDIIVRRFEPGQSIGANDAVVVIADDLIVVANLDETDVGLVKVGQKVGVRLEAYPDREFACEVEKIAYDARTISNVTMYEVDVRPERLPPFARSGMTANLEFIIEEKQGVLAVPAAAIQQGAAGQVPDDDAQPAAAGADGDRLERAMARMRETGMSEAEIKERIATFQQGGGRPGGGGARSGGRRNGGRQGPVHVLADSGDPENPLKRAVKTGISDGSFTEILEGLEEGDEVLIRKIRVVPRSPATGSPFMPGGGGRR